MARLPGTDALGARPTPQPGRSYAGGGGQGYQPVAPTGDRQLASAYEGLGEAVYRGGSVAADAERKAKEKEDRYQEAAAHSAFLRKKVELDNSFDDDPEYQTYGKRYEEGIKRAREDAAAMIKDPDRRALFDLKAGDASALGMEQIGKKAQAKEKDIGRGYLIDTLNANQKAALEARDPATRDALLLSTDSSLEAARAKGHISYEEEAVKRRESTEKFAESWARTVPSDQLAKLLAPKTVTGEPSKSVTPYLAKVAQVESGGDPRIVNPNSGAAGLFQFHGDTAKAYGVTADTPVGEQTAAATRLTADNKAALSKNLGRDPTDAELYLAHQQGAGGATALLQNPDRSAVDVLTEVYRGNRARATQAVVQNGGKPDMTAGEFSAKQQARFTTARPATDFATTAPGGEVIRFPKTGTPLDFLPADKRVALYDQSLRSVVALDERAQKQAEKALAEARDGANKDLADIQSAGRLDTEAVQRRRSVLSSEQYQSWLKAVDPKVADIKDNRETVAALEPMLDSPDAGSLIQREYQLGNLSTPTYVRMVEKNRSLLKDDMPDSPRKSARSFLSDALDPGQLGGDSMMQQPLRIARQRALADLDTWVEANPKVSRVQAMQKADEILTQYQTVGFGEMRLSLPRPRGFTGNKQDVKDSDVQAARAGIVAQIDAGTMMKDQAARELDALDVWDKVIAKAVRK